ncbi:MAG TPA: TIGR03960 family radical SAM protein [Nitrospiraceae bacterium]|nr:TIGR03960 family radical SAM protein [Nitrospiraceae bacterium]
MYEDFLPLVSKPARYINSEINAVHKDLAAVRTKVCLLFPDTYEVGMSHIGIRILYDILNHRNDTACERVFSPWTDYEALLRKSGRPLASLESGHPLRDFDIIGVTLQYELSYTNVLTALDLAGIPLRSADRNAGHPVIIAGGPCAVNPEPLSEYIDAFYIGEAEEALHDMVELRQRYQDRQLYLEALASCDGFYVPALGRKPVQRRFLREIESAPSPERPLLPLMKPVHDRVTSEIARGCIRGCRFCQAGVIYRPYRERSPEKIADLLRQSLNCTGYDELSLASLSAGDHSAIQKLVGGLIDEYRNRRVSISLPSLRIGTLTPDMIDAIAGVRKTGFTLAPEAGTERLRRVINKPLSENELMAAAETIFRSGWSTLKLYFMIGLPTETDEDLDGIIRLARDLMGLGKRTTRRPVQLNITISTFVPKPHTPFQWSGQAPIEEIRRKQTYLAAGLKQRGISLKPHSPEMSLLEGAFARGDASLGPVIEEAMRRGCRFDGWSETFDIALWREAFQACGLEPGSFAYRAFEPDQDLPWKYVDVGVTPAFLQRERVRALAGEVTENCRVRCEGCGMGCTDGGTPSFGVPAAASGKASIAPESAEERRAPTPGPSLRIRLKYTKEGRLRFLSHLDSMTLFQRALARARIPVLFSQGFNPHPKLSFGPALPVGMESDAEHLDMETDPFVDLLTITKSLNSALPEGVRILESRIVPRSAPSLSGSITRYDYAVDVPEKFRKDLPERIIALLERTELMVRKDNKKRNIRPAIEALSADEMQGRLMITIREQEGARARVHEILEQLFSIDQEESVLFRARRTAVYAMQRNRWATPMETEGT